MAILLNDIGHGRNTYPPSKGVPGLAEYTFNTAVGLETKRILEGKLKTFEAQPFYGLDVSLTTRTNKYNDEYRKDSTAIGVSHHGNANNNPDVRGFGVFYWHDHEPSFKLAKLLLKEYKEEFPNFPIWGTGLFPSMVGSWTNFHMVRETRAPFVLIEWEFMTNQEGLKLLKSTGHRKRCAIVTAKAACAYYGKEFNPVIKTNPEYTTDPKDRIGEVVIGNTAMNYRTEPSLNAPIIKELQPGHGTDIVCHLYEVKGHWLRLGRGWISNAGGSYATVKMYTKEVPFMIEKAVVINSFADYPSAEPLAARLDAPIMLRRTAEKTKRAKEIFVCGGSKDGLKADKFTDLSGADRYETARKIEAYLKK